MPPNKLSEAMQEWTEVFMRRSGHDFKRFMVDTGLSFTQVNVVMRLFRGGASSVSEIGEHAFVTNAAASQTVDQLVQLGLIERTEDPNDRRAKQLTLTPKGRALIDNVIKARSKWIETLADSLTPEQQELIISAFTLLTEAANKKVD